MTPLKPCGTPAAYKRHYTRGEPVDEACRQANNEYATNKRRAKGSQPRPTTIDAQNVIEEIVFLLNCGEGEHAILQATGRQPKTIKRLLHRANRADLIPRIFQHWDLAA